MQSGAGMGGRRRIRGISLTPKDESGLMRPVARIAQSVEQGIENPRVLGSIPSPGTTHSEKPALGLVFCFWGFGLSIERRSIHSSPPCDSPCGQRGALCKNAPGVFVRSGHHLFRTLAFGGGFCFWRFGLSIERRSIHSSPCSQAPGHHVRDWHIRGSLRPSAYSR